MRRISRIVTVAMLLIGVAPIVAGCADGEIDMDKLDVLGLNKKKPMPGKREALFPNGVPGVEQGIPPEYMKGNLAEQPGAAVAVGPLTQPAGSPNAQTASAEPQAAVQAKEKPKAKPKKRVAARPKPTRVRIAPKKPSEQPVQAQPQAAPAQAQQQAPSPWPDQQQSVPAPWPSAPPPGTFSKQ
ncbi:MAG TPA: hypothetical protein VG270_13070 [Pseudolabrys sp.]|jgi:hypothetical protein|nr:hypothetical protein [Pseudolabrys sp.]